MRKIIRRVAKVLLRKALVMMTDADAEAYLDHPNGAEWLEQARAVIEAMRDPTDRMVGAGTGYVLPLTLWRAMIDEALREP